MKTKPCPICGVTFDVPEPPPLAPGLAAIFGTTAIGLAETHHFQNMTRLENEIARHMEGHNVEEWLTAIRERDAKIRALEERLDALGSDLRRVQNAAVPAVHLPRDLGL